MASNRKRVINKSRFARTMHSSLYSIFFQREQVSSFSWLSFIPLPHSQAPYLPYRNSPNSFKSIDAAFAPYTDTQHQNQPKKQHHFTLPNHVLRYSPPPPLRRHPLPRQRRQTLLVPAQIERETKTQSRATQCHDLCFPAAFLPSLKPICADCATLSIR